MACFGFLYPLDQAILSVRLAIEWYGCTHTLITSLGMRKSMIVASHGTSAIPTEYQVIDPKFLTVFNILYIVVFSCVIWCGIPMLLYIFINPGFEKMGIKRYVNSCRVWIKTCTSRIDTDIWILRLGVQDRRNDKCHTNHKHTDARTYTNTHTQAHTQRNTHLVLAVLASLHSG